MILMMIKVFKSYKIQEKGVLCPFFATITVSNGNYKIIRRRKTALLTPINRCQNLRFFEGGKFYNYFFSLFIFLLVTGCSVKQKEESLTKRDVAKSSQKSHFIRIPITKLSSIQVPCVDIEIENKQFSVEIDLGMQGDLAIAENVFDIVTEKELLYEKQMYGFRGKQYIPKELQKLGAGA